MVQTDVKRWLQTQLLDEVPCGIAVIDANHRIVENNRRFVEQFGEGRGLPCYERYKNRTEPCPDCIADKTFKDGKPRVNEEEGVDKHGRTAHYIVHTSPVYDDQGKVSHVLEMSTDVTDIKRLQREYNILFERVPCYVAILNRDMRIVRANEHLSRTFGEPTGKHCWEVLKRRGSKCEDCPAEKTFVDGGRHSCAQVGISKEGRQTHYIVNTAPLPRDGDRRPYVIEMALDVTEMRRLEFEKMEAERLGAVGQTVAGLAHGIKNILTGLEGGMYVVRSGLKKGSSEEIDEGWGMLERNIARISDLAKNLLVFSKGRLPQTSLVDPAALVHDVAALYRDAASKDGIELLAEVEGSILPAPMDKEGIHSCLVNLVSNAIDACMVNPSVRGRVVISCREEERTIVFEVADKGCGIDYDLKQKVFTNFFTTKGSGGTGLGLLLTRKIVQEHGGKIALESVPGEGSRFKLVLPRDRLPPLS